VFVTFEGIDRSGKTTHAALLADWLGPEARLIREPGGTEAGERIRELIKDPDVELGPRAELMLFSAARAELMSTVIQPELDRGRDVVCDRFIDSTVAYQGVARGLGVDFVEQVNSLVVGSRLPDLTVLLKIDPEQAAQRQGDGSDRFESEGIEFQRLVAGAYDELAARHADRIEVIDGSAEVGDVVDKIHELVESRR
jgi:dTMP kinase